MTQSHNYSSASPGQGLDFGGCKTKDVDLVDEQDETIPENKGACRSSFTLFIDGIMEVFDYHHIRSLFAPFGKLLNVFNQRKRKFGRRIWFSFVPFS